MRRTLKYAAVTRDEGNAADGHFPTASTGEKGKLSYLFSLSLLSPHSRGALMGRHVRILACTDIRFDAKVFRQGDETPVAFFPQKKGNQLALRGGSHHLPGLALKTTAQQVEFLGRQFSLKLIQNRRPQMKIANGYPTDGPFGQGLVEFFNGLFVIRVKGDDGIDPHVDSHPGLPQPFNVLETLRGRSRVRLEKISISWTQRDQTDPGSDHFWMTREEFDESVGNPSLGQEGESNPSLQEDFHGAIGNIQDRWMGLEGVGCRVEYDPFDHRTSSRVVQFPGQFIRKIAVKVHLAREGGPRITSGVAINTVEFAAPRYIKGIRILQASKLRPGQNPALSFYFGELHPTVFP